MKKMVYAIILGICVVVVGVLIVQKLATRKRDAKIPVVPETLEEETPIFSRPNKIGVNPVILSKKLCAICEISV